MDSSSASKVHELFTHVVATAAYTVYRGAQVVIHQSKDNDLHLLYVIGGGRIERCAGLRAQNTTGIIFLHGVPDVRGRLSPWRGLVSAPLFAHCPAGQGRRSDS